MIGVWGMMELHAGDDGHGGHGGEGGGGGEGGEGHLGGDEVVGGEHLQAVPPQRHVAPGFRVGFGYWKP